MTNTPAQPQGGGRASMKKELPEHFRAYKHVWVFVEMERGQVHPVSWELMGEGRKLADKLGMRQPSLYHYFRSKEDLVEQVIHTFAADMMEVSLQHLPQRLEEVPAWVRDSVLALYERPTHPLFVRVLFSISRSHNISTSGRAPFSTSCIASGPLARIRSSGSLPSGSVAKRRLLPGASSGSARSTARKAARLPALSPSKQSTGSSTILQHKPS